MVWTEHDLAELERRHRAGETCGEIARAIGRTRNAVIGKLLRSGLTARAYTEGYRVKPPRKGTHPPSRVKVRPKTPNYRINVNPALRLDPALLAEAPPPENMPGVTFAELEPHCCKFPIGDPQSPDFRFCGLNRVSPLPYCAYHARISYQGPTPRKERPYFYGTKD